MRYNPSINIEQGINTDFQYIVTENSKSVMGNIVTNYQSGIHSFTIIGTYGTGKSSFLMAMERDLNCEGSELIPNRSVFTSSNNYEFLNITGDYTTLESLLASKLNVPSNHSHNVFKALDLYLESLSKQHKFLFIIIDEFGKILEHAANHVPEKELYFLQQLAEYVNQASHDVILITTLHQNFSSYAYKLNEIQKNEWVKVKGRFKEIVFVEPVEQLLFLASEHFPSSKSLSYEAKDNLNKLHCLAKKSNIISEDMLLATSKKLYPLDPISATCLTLAIQRYGQNERTLFSFLNSKGESSFEEYLPSSTLTFNLACVYDYITYNFYSYLSEVNADSMNWRAMRVAIERIESGIVPSSMIGDSLKLAKSIGLLNLFCSNSQIDKFFLILYGENALDIKNTEKVIDKLTSLKIIRFALYKSQYILFEGTDIDIEDELYKAANIVPLPSLSVEEISPYVNQKASQAVASYYNTGTPRYFEFLITNEPYAGEPTGDIDGYIDLVFPLSDNVLEDVKKVSCEQNAQATIFVYFNNCNEIKGHLYEIKKLQYIIDNVALDDKIAVTELKNQLVYESKLLNTSINEGIFSSKNTTEWIYNNEVKAVENHLAFNKLLTYVCEKVYYATPIIKNELINKERISSAISLARTNLIDAMLENYNVKDFGFDPKLFPPEKTIYYTLLKNTGMHRLDEDGVYILSEPQTEDIRTLWDACDDFLLSSNNKPRRIGDLIKILKSKPYKLKRGLIDFWIPIYLLIKQQNYILYNEGTFVLSLTKEVFELIQKRPNDFSIKGLNISSLKLEFFNKYRLFLRKDKDDMVTTSTFLDTIRPFFHFYRSLNEYAKHTYKFENAATARFRDVLSEAKDPSKTFFEDLPEALGYNSFNNDEFIQQYVDLIKISVHELNTCYDNFIDRIENNIVDYFGLPKEFEDYKMLLTNKYKDININILTNKAKTFLDRLLAPSATKKEFYEKIGLVVFDRPIETLKDNEEELFINSMIHLFSELERYTSISSSYSSNDDEAFSFELASSKGLFKHQQTYHLSKNKASKANDMERKIELLLSGDKDLDVCTLLKLLKERI